MCRQAMIRIHSDLLVCSPREHRLSRAMTQHRHYVPKRDEQEDTRALFMHAMTEQNNEHINEIAEHHLHQ